MANFEKHVHQALAILRTRPACDQIEITSGGLYVTVDGQDFDYNDPDDQAVLRMLLSDPEFTYALSLFEAATQKMRELQKQWEIVDQEVLLEVAA